MCSPKLFTPICQFVYADIHDTKILTILNLIDFSWGINSQYEFPEHLNQLRVVKRVVWSRGSSASAMRRRITSRRRFSRRRRASVGVAELQSGATLSVPEFSLTLTAVAS